MQKLNKEGLTRKQKAFADKLIANPKMSATKAVIETYSPTTYGTARQIASQNLAHPSILKYLDKHLEQAEITVLNIMTNSEKLKDEPAHAKIALDSANSVLDRVLGKATQKTESQSTVVTLDLKLTDITKG
jgi:phage terminase small subunit